MKQHYKSFDFKPATLALIHFLDEMIEDYQRQGYTLSVRQLYYQLVARGKVENTERSYKRVASIINDARLAGMLDWDAIEDRGRDIVIRSRWTSGRSILSAVADQFHMDLWDGQESRVFVVVEKAALVGVLGNVCHEFDVPLLAARGYPSVSIVREMCQEHFVEALNNGQRPVILHLGDHDPSGIDMTRDLAERIELFLDGEGYSGEFDLIRLALTMAQVRQVNPPPNPAKTTDSRFAGYMREYGHESWELDALPPEYINDLVRRNILRFVDEDALEARREEIEGVRKRLKRTAEEFAA